MSNELDNNKLPNNLPRMLLRQLFNRNLRNTHLFTNSSILAPYFSHPSASYSTTTPATYTSPPAPVHKPNSPLTLGRKTLRKRHQKRYKMRGRQTQLNNKVVKEQKIAAVARRDAKRVSRWREAAVYKAKLLAQVAANQKLNKHGQKLR